MGVLTNCLCFLSFDSVNIEFENKKELIFHFITN